MPNQITYQKHSMCPPTSMLKVGIYLCLFLQPYQYAYEISNRLISEYLKR